MKTAAGMFKNNLPTVLVENVVFKNVPGEAMNEVELKLSVQILAETDVRPYKIIVVASNNARDIMRLTNYESYAKNIIKDEMTPSNFKKMYLVDDYDKKSFTRERLLDATTGKRVLEKTIKVKRQSYKWKDFTNLYIYAVAYAIDVQDQTPTSISRNVRAMNLGVPAAETVYLRNKPASVGVVYVLKESMEGYGKRGEVWCGPVHIYHDAYMAGAVHTNKPHPALFINFVSNQKVQDLSFMTIQDELFTTKFSLLNRKQLKNIEIMKSVAKANNGISDAQYCRTRSNILKAFFSLNYPMIVANNTALNFLFTNKTALQSCFKIEDIRLFRTRIRQNVSSNSLTPGKINICGVKAQDSPKFVGSLKSEGIVPITYQNLSSNVLSYIGSDIEMASIETGVYEYRIIIDAVDSSAAAINFISANLNKKLAEYDVFLKKVDANGQKNYDPAKRTQAIGGFLKQDGAWRSLIDHYLASIMFVFGKSAFSTYNAEEWRKNLVAMANPASADMEKMYVVRTLVHNFVSSLNRVANAPTLGRSSRKFNVRSKISSIAPSIRRIKIEHVFPNSFENNFDAQTGFDYLDSTLVTETPALSTMTFNGFNGRIGAEVGKFSVSEPNSGGVNKVGYLTPIRINTPTNIINTSNLEVGLTNVTDLFRAQAAPTIGGLDHSSPRLSFSRTVTANQTPTAQMDELLLLADVSVVPLPVDIRQIRMTAGATHSLLLPAADAAMNAANFLSTGSVFINENSQETVSLSGSNERTLRFSHPAQNNGAAAALASNLASTIINSQMTSFRQRITTPGVSAIRTSLAAKKLDDNPQFAAANNSATTAVNLNSVQSIQFFAGFETNRVGVTMLESPRWELLTPQIYTNYQNSKAILLCRLQKTNNITNGGNKLELPAYDDLFILGSTSAADPRASITLGRYRGTYAALLRLVQGAEKNVVSSTSSPVASLPTAQISSPVIATTGMAGPALLNLPTVAPSAAGTAAMGPAPTAPAGGSGGGLPGAGYGNLG